MKVSLILGAGASQPYTFPTGDELKTELLKKGDNGYAIIPALKAFGYSEEVIERFLTTVRKGEHDTIDEFIYRHRTDDETVALAKVAVALIISGYEKDDLLFGQSGTRWYRLLLRFLDRNVEMLDPEKFRILTFNYDRSIEHYLYDSMHHADHQPKRDSIDRFFTGNFIHIHGNLGFLPWQNRSNDRDMATRPYGEPISRESAKLIASRMLLPFQNIDKADFRSDLLKSDLVVILGFGFSELNRKQIGFSELVKKQGLNILATARQASVKDFLVTFDNVTAIEHECSHLAYLLLSELEKNKAQTGKMVVSDGWLMSLRAGRALPKRS